MNAIEVRDASKRYRRYSRRRNFGTLKSALLSRRGAGDVQPDQVFDALRGVSFDVDAGRTVGIIGRNGSGKSTMLKLLAGIGKPTAGSVHITGRVSALIELGAGFHPEISGRDNVFINGMMLGLSKREIARRFDDIVAFAGLEDFIDAPVKTYSSGMYMRLGFAVAINVDPDVLLVDEVLAVGDEAFTHKCLDAFADLRRRGKTVVLVTHSLDLVLRFCDEAIWLDEGRLRAQGDPKRVVDAYLLAVAKAEDRELAAAAAAPPPPPPTDPAVDEPPVSIDRWGSGEAEIAHVELRVGGVVAHVFESGAAVDICIRVHARQPLNDFVFGIGIFNADGVCCYGTNTHVEGATPGELAGDADVTVSVDSLPLVEGTYKLDVAVHREGGAPYDYRRQLYTFRVTSRLREVGVFRPPHRWTFGGGITMSGL